MLGVLIFVKDGLLKTIDNKKIIPTQLVISVYIGSN
jgi:hypothetical protein